MSANFAAKKLPSTSQVPSVLPDRYYTGFMKSPTAFLLINDGLGTEQPFLVIGTLVGSIEVVEVKRSAQPTVLFEHISESQVSALILKSSDDFVVSFYVQIRGHEVLQLELTKTTSDSFAIMKRKSITLSHFGFCKTLYERSSKHLFIPSKSEADSDAIVVHYESGGEKVIALGRAYLLSRLRKIRSKSEEAHQDAFNGTILFMELIYEQENGESCERLIVAWEDCSIIVFDLRTKTVVDMFKSPTKYSQLITVAIHKCAVVNGWRLAVSVCSRIFELVYKNQQFELSHRIKKTGYASINCSHLIFSTSGDKLLCAFTNGRIEFYSVPDYEMTFICHFHETNVYLFGISPYSFSDPNTDLLFVGDDSGKLSQLRLAKLDEMKQPTS